MLSEMVSIHNQFCFFLFTPIINCFLMLLLLMMGLLSQASIVVSSCPSSCYCDENSIYVSCIGDSVWDLSLPVVPSSVVRLEIRNFKIGMLSPMHLMRMKELQELKLQQTKIDLLANGSFSQLTKLERLDLSENSIENLTSSTMDGLQTSLRYLDLSSNRLMNIEEAFIKLSSVEQINLRNNRLSNLTINTFLGLVKLQYLNLDMNDIKVVELGTFIHLTHLAHLILSNNPFSSLSRLDSVSTRLQYIDISNIGLKRIPQGIDPFVRDLRLAKNRITSIASGEFENYPYLSLLVLDDNQIEDIEQDAMGRLDYLVRLFLNGNKLTRLNFNLPTSIRELYLEENQIQIIETLTLKSLINLQMLSLRRNRIHQIEHLAFAGLFSLKFLDVQSNEIAVLSEGMFANLTNLETLDLSYNNINRLEENCFIGLTNLKILHLSHLSSHSRTTVTSSLSSALVHMTSSSLSSSSSSPSTSLSNEIYFKGNIFDPLQKIRTLEMYDSQELVGRLVNSTEALNGLGSIEELNIMNNKLTNLRDDFPKFFPLLKSIKLDGNQWKCDKNILWLTKWMKTSNHLLQFGDLQGIRCSSPASFGSKPLINLNPADFGDARKKTSSNIHYTSSPSKAGGLRRLDSEKNPETTTVFTSSKISSLKSLPKTTSSLNPRNNIGVKAAILSDHLNNVIEETWNSPLNPYNASHGSTETMASIRRKNPVNNLISKVSLLSEPAKKEIVTSVGGIDHASRNFSNNGIKERSSSTRIKRVFNSKSIKLRTNGQENPEKGNLPSFKPSSTSTNISSTVAAVHLSSRSIPSRIQSSAMKMRMSITEATSKFSDDEASSLVDSDSVQSQKEREKHKITTPSSTSLKFLTPLYSVVTSSSSEPGSGSKERKQIQTSVSRLKNHLTSSSLESSSDTAYGHHNHYIQKPNSLRKITTFPLIMFILASLFLVIGVLLVAYTIFKRRIAISRRSSFSQHHSLRNSSSVSYFPQNDEVAFVAEAEGHVAIDTDEHYIMKNKLYFEVNEELSVDLCEDTFLQRSSPLKSTDRKKW